MYARCAVAVGCWLMLFKMYLGKSDKIDLFLRVDVQKNCVKTIINFKN